MAMVIDRLKLYLFEPVSAFPLAGFRILYGLLLLISTLRFLSKGWVEKMYIQPKTHFKYWGFEWVDPLPGEWMYLPFIIMCFAAIGIACGRIYKLSCWLFFFMFTYVELIDSTNYLNHYYLVSILTLLMAIIPADAAVSWGKPDQSKNISRFYILIIKLQIALVYIFAGLAKLEYSWLFEAQPLQIWLRAHNHLPIIGHLLSFKLTAYLFSWSGCIYDLCIPIFLFSRKWVPIAFIAVIVFHLLTALLFPIGVFPYVMIVAAAIFLPESWYQKILKRNYLYQADPSPLTKPSLSKCLFVVVFFIIQMLLPIRYLCYEGNHLWTEQGYRFSWRVMLIEKAGTALFYAKDEHGKTLHFENAKYLTPMQEKQMSFQADQMVCYAYFLKDLAKRNGLKHPTIHVESYVSMNGAPSKPFIDESIDLSAQSNSIFKNKSFILPQE